MVLRTYWVPGIVPWLGGRVEGIRQPLCSSTSQPQRRGGDLYQEEVNEQLRAVYVKEHLGRSEGEWALGWGV